MNELRKVLVSKAELESKVRELGAVISRDYEGKELVLIGILKGAAVFMSDLMREITFPVAVDYMSVSSYGSSATTSGVITIKQDIDTDIRGKHVLLVEDLIDTGLTLQHLKQLFALREAASVRICTILSKPSRRLADIPIDYSGIDIPDEFVVGYGLDYAEQYRNLPEVWIVETDGGH
ncbi:MULTISPECIES: hypoxanthine phosphoribosyltransferase [unclassified Paenibacillus]|uniref:hypoxanthine phosphoribosyltransferase n=1 Tax=unclassified Paenibacillus TaxID=185978 RepID=UPI0024053988|nr:MULTISPECIES: hypoxanthine phosphoribosyltransferase [unclassified Paenibacillus]MDF9844033.1 hypoxanthine phosphoribosyltransferase [Paenibacillus sp. PastF-2]MDF9850638.1 hypoxanthine phosphoribosyltransferase [Paenibacillus sp. PastM-2]MDF9857212.1 hypoxanthine phosphoribosyltransferase [Paenibacillus sp. PastF-1]MDH6482488.1 hypoxanthine phosphoribosyltransferase [Paenibacillus sp. PastH-2]MDH6509909.1 hypoxanthine phosphoribosyltransferase [Paenibacillus sp. PastM-3]